MCILSVYLFHERIEKGQLRKNKSYTNNLNGKIIEGAKQINGEKKNIYISAYAVE